VSPAKDFLSFTIFHSAWCKVADLNKTQAIVFDAYGTIFDVSSTNDVCERQYPGNGERIAQLWRQKQLQYSWLRALMDQYVDFMHVTKDALKFVLADNQLSYDENAIERLASSYATLNPYPDVADGLRSLKQLVGRLAILTNGSEDSIKQLVEHSGLATMFELLLSAEKVRTYKPNPRVYELATKELGIKEKKKILFVSGNSWDVLGAKSYGFLTVWINRSGQRESENLGMIPDFKVGSLNEIRNLLSRV
jgi:2-haloacid dehalogenase